MKRFIIFLIVIVGCYQQLQAQKTYKFYNEQDSIDYHHYQMIMSNGFKISVEDGVFKRELVDSSYQDPQNFIGYDSAFSLLREIPKFDYYLRSQSETHLRANQLKNHNKYDTITHISFEGEDIKRLPLFKLLKCKNLKEIELVNTSVKKIPWLLNWSIFGLDSLETIRIYNHAPGQRIKFTRNINIKELVYRDSPYSPVPKNFHKLKNVKEIDFARNDFREDSKFHLEKLQNLEHLNLSRNNIDLQNIAKDSVEGLKYIVLSFNNLTSVPKQIGLLKDLVDLQFAENDIKSDNIHPALGSLKNLEVLSFYKNDLDSLPSFLFNLIELVELDLYFNQIEKLPEELGNLQKLERLYVAHNRFFSIPESIGKLRSLKEFYIHHNRISYLPESIADLEHITDFHIQNNYFQGFPEFILNYKELEDLDISFNEIHTFPTEILKLVNLKYLWMRGITFEAGNKKEAEELKNTLETLQRNGVKVSIELEQEISP
ncbi:leucine-rich repeat domain-containing protein [Marivirga harenae]|uniref:leucine-rich repeat domain-containing protein n=1 Tax=Marivirga harenae TaxID=2010992 RepID=UPI0026DF027D|nr:leucine-rich repeat domain-containing protein [Marivirga harenae]WKV11663.1 leucine-rich repeat domain-containing protein [Marivirga harenae]|tara:strand:+ start:171170 stop:172630 length:1461 start_codon:yes stop_codon:yes gene_type:complete